jgi:hypothetical protein
MREQEAERQKERYSRKRIRRKHKVCGGQKGREQDKSVCVSEKEHGGDEERRKWEWRDEKGN